MAGRPGVVCQARPMTDSDDLDRDEIEVTCPRCATVITARFYGPCPACRAQLRATVGGQAHQLESADYEPKMNVTPNAVATKD
jgi:Zn finger protein HypA/HybF involved in hydrogenase expression